MFVIYIFILHNKHETLDWKRYSLNGTQQLVVEPLRDKLRQLPHFGQKIQMTCSIRLPEIINLPFGIQD